jgi:hypothetical protein
MPPDDSFSGEAVYEDRHHVASSPVDQFDWQYDASDSRAEPAPEPPATLPELFSRLRK